MVSVIPEGKMEILDVPVARNVQIITGPAPIDGVSLTLVMPSGAAGDPDSSTNRPAGPAVSWT